MRILRHALIATALAAPALLGGCRAQPASESELAEATSSQASTPTGRDETPAPNPPDPSRVEPTAPAQPPAQPSAPSDARPVDNTAHPTAAELRRQAMISQISEGSSEITYRDRYETVQRVDRLPTGARRVQVPTRIEAPRINVQRALALPPTVTTGSATPLLAPPTVQR